MGDDRLKTVGVLVLTGLAMCGLLFEVGFEDNDRAIAALEYLAFAGMGRLSAGAPAFRERSLPKDQVADPEHSRE